MKDGNTESVRSRIDAIVDRQEAESAKDVASVKKVENTPKVVEVAKKPVDRPKKNEKKTNRAFWLVFSVISAIVLALVVGIVLVSLKNNSSMMDESAEEILAKIDDEIEGMDEEEEIIDVYQQYITDSAKPKEKAVILRAKIQRILEMDLLKQYGDVMIMDAIEVDNIEQSFESAGFVVNTASFYGRDGIIEEYIEILNERGDNSGMGANEYWEVEG